MSRTDLNCRSRRDEAFSLKLGTVCLSGPLSFRMPSESTNMRETRDYRGCLHSIDFSFYPLSTCGQSAQVFRIGVYPALSTCPTMSTFFCKSLQSSFSLSQV